MNDEQLYQRGALVAHSSDGGGLPDVGISVGLGGGRMLYAGERPGQPGWSICLYPAEGEATDIAAGVDAEGAASLIEAVAAALSRED